MKTTRYSLLKLTGISTLTLALAIYLLFSSGRLNAQEPEAIQASDVGTAFTYQGRLTDGGAAANGTYDFQFSLFDAKAGGKQVGAQIASNDVAVAGGLFAVGLDFGDVFDGTALFLQIDVRPGAATGNYTPLSPRQALLAAPYALTSLSSAALQGHAVNDVSPTTGQVLKWDGAQWSPGSDNSGGGNGGGNGPVSWNDISGIPSDLVDGDNDTTYSAGAGLNLNGSNAFNLAGSYRLPQGCATNQIIKWDGSAWVCANDQSAALAARVAALEAASATQESRLAALETLLVHVSRSGNELTISGANLHVVNGLGSTETSNSLGNVIIGYNELRESEPNERNGSHVLAVGSQNNYTGYGGIVVGNFNKISGHYTSVSGGTQNTASGNFASVSGGALNRSIGALASASGGTRNTVSGEASSVSGGENNVASGENASVSGGGLNLASGSMSSVSGGYQNVASGGQSSASGGARNTAGGAYASVSGGENNTASGVYYASVSGGAQNTASGEAASVSGGSNNSASGNYASVSGGGNNQAIVVYTSVSGGDGNKAGYIGGGVTKGEYASVSGGFSNRATGPRSSVSGGGDNTADGSKSSVSGGNVRVALSTFDWRAGTLFQDQ